MENAKSAKIKIIVAQSVNIESLKKTIEVSKKYPEIVRLSAGLYPEHFLKESDFDELSKIIKENEENIFAIGEIGMDFSYDEPSRELQEKIFRKQLELAEKLNIPVSIHTRKAEKEIVEILKEYPNVKKILHCFSGKIKLAKEAEEIGCYFSIPTNIVRSEHFQKLVKEISRDRILTETDSPYLSPFLDTKNEPANIVETIKIMANIWNCSILDAEVQIENNFNKMYQKD